MANGEIKGKNQRIKNFIKSKGLFGSMRDLLGHSRLGDMLVKRGKITADQLSTALTAQKNSKTPLGRVLLQEKMISRLDLQIILGKQMMLRGAATCVLALTAFSAIKSKNAQAEYIKDVPAQLTMSITNEFSKMAAYPALFGTAEKRNKDLKAFTKWTGMFDRFDRSLKTERGARVMQDMKSDLRGIEGQPLVAMAAAVNKMMNAKPYTGDSRLWGKSDYWATPVEFMERGGDCEDYAIAKYTALRALGVPEERMRLAIVQDLKKNIPHAILIVYTDQGPYALDNQNRNLVNGAQMKRYKPIFSINRTAWWLHSAPRAQTQMASVQ